MNTLFEEFKDDNLKIDDKYSQKTLIPHYEPSAQCPHISQLVNTMKTERLIREINNSNVSDMEKNFLIEAAHRHSAFNYSKIADYYAHATKEMQELMEKSALVLVDFNDAIAYGYVKMSDRIRKIQEESGKWAKDEYANQWTKK